MSTRTPGRERWSSLVLFPMIGAIALSLLSIPQKIALGADYTSVSGFVVPVIFGGAVGFFIALAYRRNQRLLIEKLRSDTAYESHDRLVRDLVATIPGVVYQLTIDTKGVPAFTYVSPSVTALTGLQPDDITRDPELLFGVIRREDRDDFDRSILESSKTLAPWHWEGRVRNRSRAEAYFRGMSRPRKLADGSVQFNGIFFDVTDLSIARRDLQNAHDNLEARVEERTRELSFQKLALDSHAIVSTTDPQGYITYANDKFCEISGYSREELIGQSHGFLKSGQHKDGFYTDLWNTITNGDIWHGVIVNKRKDGGLYTARATIVPFLDKDGKPFQFIAIRTDISDQKEAEAAIERERQKAEQAQKIAETANRAKSEFLSSMSHELRTPLNAILGFAQLLEVDKRNPLTSKQSDHIHQVIRGGEHLLELINQVLDLATVEAGKMSLSIETIATHQILDDCLVMIDQLAKSRGIEIINGGADGLPNVSADLLRAKQVLLNLLSNAVKYNRQNGKIWVSAELRDNQRLRISVRDNGNGIAVDQQDKLFSPFQRLGAETSNIEGSGIGLALAKKIVELMSGAIGFESTVGTGSTFWVEFPISDPGASETAKIAPAPEAAYSIGDENYTILYVEDNAQNMALIETFVEHLQNTKFLSAETGKDGLDLARNEVPDIIILDINLPDMSGIDVVRHLKEDARTRHIPVIALTANAMKGAEEAGMAAGFCRYLSKPINLNLLAASIQEELERAGNS